MTENGIDKQESKADIMVLVGRKYLKDMKDKIAELEGQLQATSTTLNDTNGILENTKTKITELEGKLVEKESKMKAISDRNTELTEQQANFDEELNEIKEQKMKVESKMLSYEIKIAELNSELIQFQEQIQIKGRQIIDMEGQMAIYVEELDVARNERVQMRNENANLREQIGELRKISEGATGQAGQLDQLLQHANYQLKDLETQISKLENKIKTVEMREQEGKKQNRDLENKIAEKLKEINNLEENLQNQKDMNAELGMEIVNANAARDKARKLTNQKESENAALKDTIASLEGKIQQLNGVIGIRDQKLHEIEHSFKAQGIILTQREIEIKDWQEKYSEIEAQLKGPVKEPKEATRITCPNCHATEINKVEDKKKVLSYIGYMPIYAKKNQCPKCGHIWA